MWHHSQKIYHVYQVISNYSQRMPTHDKYNNVCHTIITLFPDNMCVPWYSHNVYWQCGSICSILNEDYCTMLYLMKILVIIVWLVVWNIRSFSIHWEFHHPNWRTHIFQRGRYTTNQIWVMKPMLGRQCWNHNSEGLKPPTSCLPQYLNSCVNPFPEATRRWPLPPTSARCWRRQDFLMVIAWGLVLIRFTIL